MNLAAMLESVARRLPDAAAIRAPGQADVSFARLMEDAAGIAGALRDRFGLNPGDRIAIFMENHVRFFPLLFGIWRAGLSAVPINAKLHAREVSWICENSEARLLFASAKSAQALAGVADAAWPRIIDVDGPDWDGIAGHAARAQHDGTSADEAWLFYTSGTTGRPKGAMLSHRALLFMCHAYYADIDFLGPGDTMLQSAPLTHGSGLYGLAAALRGGGNVILPGFDADQVFEAIARYPNVSFFAAPTMVTRLVNAPNAGARDLSNLKTITYGGAPMYVADLKRALDLFGPRLYQLFGQGESPMTITGLPQTLHVDTGDPGYEQILASTGFARTGVEVRIAREDGSPAEPGEVGEILTKSDALMTGYWANPDANAKAIRDGWLWTGDLGAMDARGFLTIKDRSKDMIISGGTNIYPREIEEVLLTHPGVLECAVTGVPHPDWGEEVVAFVVRRPGHDAAVSEVDLDRLCLDNIARFKRPKRYQFLDALPKNNYGKILKTELRALG